MTCNKSCVFSQDSLVSSTNKTDHHDLAGIFKVTLSPHSPSIHQVDINRHNEFLDICLLQTISEKND